MENKVMNEWMKQSCPCILTIAFTGNDWRKWHETLVRIVGVPSEICIPQILSKMTNTISCTNLLALCKKYTVMWYIFHIGTFPIHLKFQEFFSLYGVGRTNLNALLWCSWLNYLYYFIYFTVCVSEIQIAFSWEGKYFCLAFFSVIKF
jgi:hypothetical protein